MSLYSDAVESIRSHIEATQQKLDNEAAPFNDVYRTVRWKRVGELTYKYPKYVLICQYAYGNELSNWMVVHLGSIKQRHDNRWDWWQYNAKSQYWKNETKQGVSNTLEEAQQQVEKGWIDG